MAKSFYDAIEQLRPFGTEFQEGYCAVNGGIYSLSEIAQLGLEEFCARSKNNMPLKFYKYFPNTISVNANTSATINYSQKALLSNEVFLNAPTEFDDVYDSEIGISFPEYALVRLRQYASRSGLTIADNATLEQIEFQIAQRIFEPLSKGEDILASFIMDHLTQGERLSFENFLLITCSRAAENQIDLHSALVASLQEEYNSFFKKLKNVFRTSCFATTPFSQLMWGGAYANNHRGFCLEYTVRPDDPQYKEIINNLYPVIYSKVRGKIPEQIIAIQDVNITEETLWSVYFHGALRKSLDWAYQNEWRLLLPAKGEGGYTALFFPITKVFLGNRMEPTARAEIINICHQKKIPYIGVTRAIDRFEMQECQILCENCPNFLVEPLNQARPMD